MPDEGLIWGRWGRQAERGRGGEGESSRASSWCPAVLPLGTRGTRLPGDSTAFPEGPVPVATLPRAARGTCPGHELYSHCPGLSHLGPSLAFCLLLGYQESWWLPTWVFEEITRDKLVRDIDPAFVLVPEALGARWGGRSAGGRVRPLRHPGSPLTLCGRTQTRVRWFCRANVMCAHLYFDNFCDYESNTFV